MSEHIRRTIEELQLELRKQEADVADTKQIINKLCVRAGMPPMYAETDPSASSSIQLSIQSDQFYGQPLAANIRTILEMRRASKQGPASVNDIYAGLQQGGYRFETKDEQNAKRGLRVSLTKNTALFHKLPNGLFGLTDWYPKIKRREAAAAQEEEPEEPVTTANGDETTAEGEKP